MHQITRLHQLALLWLKSIGGDSVPILHGVLVCSVLFLQLFCLFRVEGLRDFGKPTDGVHGALRLLSAFLSYRAGHLSALRCHAICRVFVHSSP